MTARYEVLGLGVEIKNDTDVKPETEWTELSELVNAELKARLDALEARLDACCPQPQVYNVALAATSVGQAGVSSVVQTPPGGGPGVTGQFQFWPDGKLYDPQGNAVMLKGINAHAFPGQINDIPTMVNAWGFNCVEFMAVNDFHEVHTVANMRNWIIATRSAGAVAMVGWNQSGAVPGTEDPFHPGQTYNETIRAFYEPLLQEFGNDPGVMWAPWTEPIGRPSGVLYDANGVPSWNETAIDAWVNWAHEFYTMARQYTQSPILFGLPIWGTNWLLKQNPNQNDAVTPAEQPLDYIAPALRYANRFDDMDNVAFESHQYVWRSNAWDSSGLNFDTDVKAIHDQYKQTLLARGVRFFGTDITSHLAFSGPDADIYEPQLHDWTLAAVRGGFQPAGTGFWVWLSGGQTNGSNALTVPIGDGSPGDGSGRFIGSRPLTEWGQKIKTWLDEA